MKILRAFLFAAVAVLPCVGASVAKKGVYVQDGAFFREGRPLNAHGINYYNLFIRALEPSGGDSDAWKASFAALKRYDIPFVRFAATPFMPKGFALYAKDKAAYFKKLDAVVAEAERLHIGLIPSFFWQITCVPDFVGEPVGQWGNSESKTRRFMRAYTQEVVSRYKDSPAIWGWEFGNEFMLAADIREQVDPQWKIHPPLGTPTVRTNADLITREAIRGAYREFGQIVRELDKDRIILTGDALQRPASWDMSYGSRHWKTDSPQQFAQILLDDSPAPVDTLCIHYYLRPDNKMESYAPFGKTHTEILRFVKKIGEKAGKPLFVGEYGVGEGDAVERQRLAQDYFDAIRRAGISMSCYWVYDLDNQKQTFSVRADDENAFVLDALKKLNASSGK